MTVSAKTIIRMPEGTERRAAARMTGRYILCYDPADHHEVTGKLRAAGFDSARPVATDAARPRPLPHGGHYALEHIGVAVVDPTSTQEPVLGALADQEEMIVAMVPERIARALDTPGSLDFLRGWREATVALADRLVSGAAPAAAMRIGDAEASTVTWGLSAIGVPLSRYTGQGIKLAVLDTGLDVSHPDFAGRQITVQNFVGDQAPFHDGVGHGTHCMGSAGGPLHPGRGARYGIAYEAALYAGRVLDDTGRGGDGNILQGIDWAIAQGCDIVSLSLGAPWMPGDTPFNAAYEQAAKVALARGCLLVVAAGNEADDADYIGAVGTPGNSPSVLTVAAVDSTLATAPFSDRVQPAAPGVKGPDCAGPGVDVYSAWPVAMGAYNTISGTSMATPHVAGIAALLAQANPGLRGQALKDEILRRCKALTNQNLRRGEIGSGLVQAP
jgi:subtilisin